MPSDLDGDKLERAMVAALHETTTKVEGILARVDRKLEQHYERTARLLADYRQDNHRTVMSIYTRLVSIEDTFETERGSRVARQTLLDGELRSIHDNQRTWIRVVIFAAILAIGIGIGWFVR